MGATKTVLENRLKTRIFRSLERELKIKYGKSFDYPKWVATRAIANPIIEQKLLDKFIADDVDEDVKKMFKAIVGVKNLDELQKDSRHNDKKP